MRIATLILGIVLTLGLSDPPPKCDSFEVATQVQDGSGGGQNGSIELAIKGSLGPYSFFWCGENARVDLDFPNDQNSLEKYHMVIQDRDCSESLRFELINQEFVK